MKSRAVAAVGSSIPTRVDSAAAPAPLRVVLELTVDKPTLRSLDR